MCVGIGIVFLSEFFIDLELNLEYLLKTVVIERGEGMHILKA